MEGDGQDWSSGPVPLSVTHQRTQINLLLFIIIFHLSVISVVYSLKARGYPRPNSISYSQPLTQSFLADSFSNSICYHGFHNFAEHFLKTLEKKI